MVEPTAESSATDTPGSQGDPANRRRLAWALVAGTVVVVLAVAAGVAVALTRDESASVGASPSSTPSPTRTAVPTQTELPSPGASEAAEGPDIITDEFGRATQAPVPLDQAAEPAPGVSVSLVSIEAVSGEASGPGEVAGPALRVAVRVQNGTDGARSLQRSVVTLTYGPEQVPATEFQRSGSSPLAGEVAAGAAAEGVYVFAVPEDQRGQVRVSVDLDTDATVLLFEGAAP